MTDLLTKEAREKKQAWDNYRAMMERINNDPVEQERRKFLREHKGHCRIDEEKVNRYHENNLLNDPF